MNRTISADIEHKGSFFTSYAPHLSEIEHEKIYLDLNEDLKTQIDNLAKIVCSTSWSPILWHSKRLISNYDGCFFLVYDFDSHETKQPSDLISTLKERLNGFTYIIGLTKSHTLDTINLRIIVACTFIATPLQFKLNMTNFALNHLYGLDYDTGAFDSARMWWPCKSIDTLILGETYEVERLDKVLMLKREKEAMELKKIHNIKITKSNERALVVLCLSSFLDRFKKGSWENWRNLLFSLKSCEFTFDDIIPLVTRVGRSLKDNESRYCTMKIPKTINESYLHCYAKKLNPEEYRRKDERAK